MLEKLKKRNNKLLLFFLVIALYLRLQGINSGLPYVLNPDESDYLIKLLWVFKIFKCPVLINLLEINPGALFVPLRFFSVLFGVGTIVLVYLIGLRFNPFVAVITSGLLSVSMLHVKFSQMLLPFSALTFVCLLSSLFLIKKDISVREKSLFVKLILIGLFLNLYYLPYLPGFIIALVKNYFINYSVNSYFLYIFNFLLLGIGPVAYIGVIWLIKYLKDYNLSLIKKLFSLPILCIGLLGFLHLTKAEYTMLIIPYFCLAAGLFFNSIYERAGTDNKRLGFIFLLLLALWIPLKYTLKYQKIITLSDTRINATEWIKQNTSDNFKIAWDKNSIQPNWYDTYDKQELKYLVPDPEVLINRQKFPISLKLLENKNWFKTLKKKVDYVVINSLDYELVLRQPGRNLEKKYYRKLLKLKPYLVFNPYLKDLDKHTKSLLIEDLYSPLLTLWQRERSGPVIKVYKL